MAHWHQEWEITFVRSGSTMINVQDQQVLAQAGDIVICSSGHVHYSDPAYMKNELDFLLFHPSMLQNFSPSLEFTSPLIKADDLKKAGLDQLTLDIFPQIQSELNNKHPFYQDIVKSKIIHYWFCLLREFGTPKNIEEIRDHKRSHLLNAFQNLLVWLDEHYDENISLAYAAEKMNLSESYFSRLFKKLSGENFVNYLNMIRVEKAASQIRNSDLKIADIAYNCGFSNIRSFNRVFKELTGYTPSQYGNLPREIPPLLYYQIKSNEGREVTNQSAALIQ